MAKETTLIDERHSASGHKYHSWQAQSGNNNGRMEPANDPEAVTYFAVTDFRNIRQRFGIKERDRSGHLYILGKTGTGKSTLIQTMAACDIGRGQGMALIDPHGDLAEAVLSQVPENRINDVIFFNPSDLDYPIAFNPLEKVAPDKHHLVVSGLISVFKKIWSDFWGPRTEHLLRNSILALLEQPEGTLLDIPLLLTDRDFRGRVLGRVTDRSVRNFWLLEFEGYGLRLRSEATAPILNKIGQFLATPLVRNIVGQPRSSFDLRQIMDEGKILIADLAKGRIGDDNCSLLGSLLVTKLQLAALSRADIPEESRRPFHLFIDEIQSFLTMSFTDILSEARKYKLYLTMSHQYIGQLDERIRAAIFGNVGTVISFRVGAEDAKYLAREFYPTFDETDLVNIPNHHIYLKMMIDGQTSKAFSAVTMPPAGRTASHKDEILALSRASFGTPRATVERQILLAQKQDDRTPVPKQSSFF